MLNSPFLPMESPAAWAILAAWCRRREQDVWADATPSLTYHPSTTGETLEPVAAMAREVGGAEPHGPGVTLSAEIDGIPAISTQSVTAGPLLSSSLDSPTVGVPDRATGTVHGNLDATVKVGASPTAITVSPDGTRTYVINSGGVSVIATATNTVTTLNTGTTASAVAATDTRAYLASYSAVAVVDIDPNSTTYNQQIATIRVPAGAQDVAVSTDGGIAYVTSGDGKSVTVIDTATNAVIGTFTTDDTATTVRTVGFWGDSYSTRLVTVDDGGNVVDVDVDPTALATRV